MSVAVDGSIRFFREKGSALMIFSPSPGVGLKIRVREVGAPGGRWSAVDVAKWRLETCSKVSSGWGKLEELGLSRITARRTWLVFISGKVVFLLWRIGFAS